MDYITWGILGGLSITVAGVLIYFYKTFNLLIKLRMAVDRQTSHVEVHLKKKFDLIPALIEIVKGYTKHEKGTLEEVTRLRSQWGSAKKADEKIKAANNLDSALSRLIIVHEKYPNIKADKSFINIQKNIWHVERELAHERKVYNKRVSWYNLKLQQFPSNIVAKVFGLHEKPFFSIEPERTTESW